MQNPRHLPCFALTPRPSTPIGISPDCSLLLDATLLLSLSPTVGGGAPSLSSPCFHVVSFATLPTLDTSLVTVLSPLSSAPSHQPLESVGIGDVRLHSPLPNQVENFRQASTHYAAFLLLFFIVTFWTRTCIRFFVGWGSSALASSVWCKSSE